tara:strand:- start:800 stop:1132 length:333 start_codon:yes stop_codon:yes gene_type:complete
MGLHIEIYKNGKWDCTNGGVTSKDIQGLCITNCDGPFDPCDAYPAAELVSRKIGSRTIVNIVPTAEIEKKSWTMFGGHYGATSDSRFSEKIEQLLGSIFYGAVPIHDRVE